MPSGGIISSLVISCSVRIPEQFLPGDGADLANLCIGNAKLGCIVQHWMDVKRRCLGLAGQLAHTLHEDFLEVVGEVVLGAEEDDASL